MRQLLARHFDLVDQTLDRPLVFRPDFDLEAYFARFHNYKDPEESEGSIKSKVLARLRGLAK